MLWHINSVILQFYNINNAVILQYCNIKSAIISTNRYHLPRAIYIARRIGVEAYGIASDLRQYDRMKKYRKRERLAQIKDFFLVNFSLKKRKE